MIACNQPLVAIRGTALAVCCLNDYLFFFNSTEASFSVWQKLKYIFKRKYSHWGSASLLKMCNKMWWIWGVLSSVTSQQNRRCVGGSSSQMWLQTESRCFCTLMCFPYGCSLVANFVFFCVSPVCGVYVLEPVPVRQRTGLPQTTGQLHPSVAQPRHGEPAFLCFNWSCDLLMLPNIRVTWRTLMTCR